jgi:tetratricopeptide (TPR) repeat protein
MRFGANSRLFGIYWREALSLRGGPVEKKLCLITVFFVLLCSAALGQQTYDADLSQAKSLITQQKYADAVTEAQKAITTDGQRWEAYAVAAKAYSAQKLYDDAIGMLQIALARAPEDKKSLVRDAIADCRKRQSQGNTSSSSGGISLPNPAPQTGSAVSAPTQAEIVLWKSIENSANLSDFQAYLTQYPSGTFAALAIAHIKELEETKVQQQATEQTALNNSVLAGAEATVSNGKTTVRLATGKAGEFDDVLLGTFQGQESISFPTTFICRQAGLLGQAGYCASGRIYVTSQNVAFQRDDGKIEFLSLRSGTAIKSEGGREGDTFSIYDNQGKRYRFGSEKFDSPFVIFLQTAITGFPTAYKQVQQLAATHQ